MQRREVKFEITQCYFEWYNESTILSSDEFWEDLNNEAHEDVEDVDERAEAYLWRVRGLYEHPDNKEIVKRIMSRNDDEINEYYGMYRPRSDLPFLKEINDERDRIERVRNKCKDTISLHHHLIKDIKVSRANQKQLSAIVIILFIGVFLMVCYPLSFLPLEENWQPHLTTGIQNTIAHVVSIQGWMLLLLLVVVASVFSVFLISIRKMKKPYKTIVDSYTARYLHLWGYCEYFEQKPDKSNDLLVHYNKSGFMSWILRLLRKIRDRLYRFFLKSSKA